MAAYIGALGNGWLWLLATVFVVLVVGIALQRRMKREALLKMSVPVWSSGIPYDGTHMQATGAYFGYQVDLPLRRRRAEPPLVNAAEIIPEGLHISDRYQIIEFFQKWYNSGLMALQRFATWSTLRIQNGRVRVYVAYMVITLVGLLTAWLIWGGR